MSSPATPGQITIYDSAAALTASTMASKPFGSAMAISLSIFRFRAILAFFKPLMNWLYRTPRCRHAALNRVIHRPRKSRFLSLRPMRALTSARTVASLASRYSRPAEPRWPLTALRIRFFDWRRAAPFLTLGIFTDPLSLKISSVLQACWRQRNGHITKPRSKLYRQSSLRALFAQCDLGRPGCRAVHNGRAADSPSPFGVLTAHKMPGPGATAFDLTGRSNLDSLFQPLVGLLFRHLTTSLKRIHKNSMLCCLPTQVNIIPPIWPKISQNPSLHLSSLPPESGKKPCELSVFGGESILAGQSICTLSAQV